jgi:Na+-driven multidrug efflux pump
MSAKPRAGAVVDRRQLFLEGSIPRALTVLAVPIILGNIVQTGYQLTDAFWVGRLGASAVAAVSISFPISFLVEDAVVDEGLR